MPGSSYVWRDDSVGVALHLSLDVVTRLGLDALEAFKSVPRRGLEIGGLLLGRREIHDGRLDIFVQQFEPVESEHRSGPSYRLSESDLSRLDKAAGKHRNVVGVYRTQTRSESLTLELDDAALLARYFREGEGIFLLIQPATAQAAAFVPHQGSVHEIAFRSGELPIEEQPETSQPDVPDVPVQLPPASSPGWRLGWQTVAAAVFGGALIGAVAMARLPVRERTAAAGLPVSSTFTESVGLEARRLGGSLELHWDRNSPPIRGATHAVLEILDGSHKSELNLKPDQLAAGLFLYWPQSGDIRFRMDVFSANRTTSQSVRVIDPTVVPGPAQPLASAVPTPKPPGEDSERPSPFVVPEPVRRNQSADRKPVAVKSVIPPRVPSTSPEATKPDPPRPVERTVFTSSADRHEISKPVASLPAAAPKPAESEPLPAHPVPPPSRRPRTEISMAAEPVAGSRWGRAVGKIPLLRRLKKKPEAFVAPVPVRQVRPALNEREEAEVTHPVPVNVKVYVTESGKVGFAELMSDGRYPQLDSAAVYAARKWSFTPARSGDETVPGEMILHFTFAPAQ